MLLFGGDVTDGEEGGLREGEVGSINKFTKYNLNCHTSLYHDGGIMVQSWKQKLYVLESQYTA